MGGEVTYGDVPASASSTDRSVWSAELKARATQRIIEAGGDVELFRSYLTEGAASLILQFDHLADAWAQRFPKVGSATYGQALQETGFSNVVDAEYVRSQGGQRLVMNPEALRVAQKNILKPTRNMDYNERGFIVNADGSMLHRSGVIVVADPATGSKQVVMPTRGQANIEGSDKWITNASDNWDQARISKWRKKLSSLGYSVAKNGEWGYDLEDNLKEYWRNFYLSGGKEIPLDPAAGAGPDETPKTVYDPVERRADIDGLWKELTGYEATDVEQKRISQFVREVIQEELKGGATPEHARLKGQEALTDQITQDPGVKELTQRRDEDEEGIEFFSNVFQAMRAL